MIFSIVMVTFILPRRKHLFGTAPFVLSRAAPFERTAAIEGTAYFTSGTVTKLRSDIIMMESNARLREPPQCLLRNTYNILIQKGRGN